MNNFDFKKFQFHVLHPKTILNLEIEKLGTELFMPSQTMICAREMKGTFEWLWYVVTIGAV